VGLKKTYREAAKQALGFSADENPTRQQVTEAGIRHAMRSAKGSLDDNPMRGFRESCEYVRLLGGHADQVHVWKVSQRRAGIDVQILGCRQSMVGDQIQLQGGRRIESKTMSRGQPLEGLFIPVSAAERDNRVSELQRDMNLMGLD